MSVLVVLEQTGGKWNRMSWETLVAGQQLAAQMGTELFAAIPGSGVFRFAKHDRNAALAEIGLHHLAALPVILRQTRGFVSGLLFPPCWDRAEVRHAVRLAQVGSHRWSRTSLAVRIPGLSLISGLG